MSCCSSLCWKSGALYCTFRGKMYRLISINSYVKVCLYSFLISSTELKRTFFTSYGKDRYRKYSTWRNLHKILHRRYIDEYFLRPDWRKWIPENEISSNNTENDQASLRLQERFLFPSSPVKPHAILKWGYYREIIDSPSFVFICSCVWQVFEYLFSFPSLCTDSRIIEDLHWPSFLWEKCRRFGKDSWI